VASQVVGAALWNCTPMPTLTLMISRGLGAGERPPAALAHHQTHARHRIAVGERATLTIRVWFAAGAL
jgi:hypothetical protein